MNILDIVTYLSQVLVTIGLVATIALVILLVRKISVLENLFLMRWVDVTSSLTLVLLGIFFWFVAETTENVSMTVYVVALPLTFISVIIGELILMIVLWRRPAQR